MTTLRSNLTSSGSHVLGHYASCQRSAYYRHVLGLNPKGVSEAPIIGSAWHKALEAYYWCLAMKTGVLQQEQYPTDILELCDGRFTEAEHLMAAATMTAALGELTRHSHLAEKYGPAVELGRLMIAKYHEYAQLYDRHNEIVLLHQPDGRDVPMIEYPFAIDLGNGYTFTGRFDLVLQNRGLMHIYEHKTTSGQGYPFLEKASRMALQFTGYVNGFRRITGRMPSSVMLNAITKGKSPEVKRCPITRTVAELDAAAYDCAQVIAEFDTKIQRAEELGPGTVAAAQQFLRTGIMNGLCITYNRQCPYTPLCKSPDRDLSEFNLDYLFSTPTSEE